MLKPLYLDTEFSGLHQNTQLISLAIVADTGEEFYAEFTDYDQAQITPWITKNVLSKLILSSTGCTVTTNSVKIRGNKSQITSELTQWLNVLYQRYSNQRILFWADVPHYDWVLFCELFGGSLKLPFFIDFMCMDIASLLWSKGINPTISRYELLEKTKTTDIQHHNALYDAHVIRSLYNKLMS